MKSFLEFLQSNAIDDSFELPLVHTTRSFNLSEILASGNIKTQECDVFRGENLNCFFVGRPSYKYEIENSIDYWMLPTVFVVNFSSVTPRRVFPFDSGGFARNRMPSYIREMQLNKFDASGVERAPQKIIGAFFANPQSYYSFRGISEGELNSRFLLSPLDAEVHALHRLASEVKNPSFDDRCFCVEVQSTDSLEVTGENIIAVVAPVIYLDDPGFVRYFKSRKIEILSYDIYPLEGRMHFYAIYDKIKTLYQKLGLLT